MRTETSASIVILGISDNPDRYSYKAQSSLLSNGYTNIIGVTPKSIALKGVKVIGHLSELDTRVHTLTLYTNPQITTPLIQDILAASPKRIIMNPGTENQELKDKAELAGIEVIEGCTLVMLSTSQF